MVTMPNGTCRPTTTWDHYSLHHVVVPQNVIGQNIVVPQNAQGQVIVDFWARYKLPTNVNHEDHANSVLHKNAKDIMRDTMSYLRIQANNEYIWESQRVRTASKRASAAVYLTEEQYLQTTIPSWMRSRQEGWYGLCRCWASPEFKAISVRNRRCRGNQIVHTYGADGHIRMAKRMEARTGVAPSAIDVFVAGHKGSGPMNPNLLCTPTATQRLDAYGQEMISRHGENFNWRSEPIDPDVVYATGGGKAHGRYGMLNGVIDSRQVSGGRSRLSQSSSSRGRRHSERDLELERLQDRVRLQQEQLRQQQLYQERMSEYYRVQSEQSAA